MLNIVRVAVAGIFTFGVVLASEYIVHYMPLMAALPNEGSFLETVSWSRVGLQAVALLFGIVFGYFFELLKKMHLEGETTVELWAEFKRMLTSVRFAMAIVAAPIIFLVVLSASRDAPLFLSVAFAFQNGFFWEKVMPSGPGSPKTKQISI